MRAGFKRKAMPAQARRNMKSFNYPAPTGGWVVNENVSRQRKGTALVMENFFPMTYGVRVRKGSVKYATLTSGGPVLSMWTYKSGDAEYFFAADETNIFDISAIADPDSIPTAVVTSQTAGYYSVSAMSTAAGVYNIVVNGEDDAQLFDGSTWQALNAASTPAITGVATANLSNTWIYASRAFFIEKNTLTAWYLPVDSVGGTAADISLAGVMKKGGSLLFGATWSLDSGSGLDDKCVFISTEGEVAIYEGIDPSSSTDWRLVGVYEITKPLGPKAVFKAGGDLLIATEDGIIPLTQAVRKDPAALSLASVTRAIEPEWEQEVRSRRTVYWEMMKWPESNMIIVSQPITDSQDAQCLVANIETGAWAKFTNWDTRCLGLYADNAYFGTNGGKVYIMESSGADDGTPYEAFMCLAFDDAGTAGFEKIIKQMRPVFKTGSTFRSKSSVSVDYNIVRPSAPASVDDSAVDVWDVADWDVGVWDSGSVKANTVVAEWVSIGRKGRAVAPQIQITMGVTPAPSIELVSIDLTTVSGGLVN